MLAQIVLLLNTQIGGILIRKLSNRITIQTICTHYRTFSDSSTVLQFRKIFRKIDKCLIQIFISMLIFESEKIVSEK